MLIKLGEREFKLKFNYYTFDDNDVECILYLKNKDNYDVYACGYAICSHLDQFVRKIGRKVALARTLKEYGFSREDRTEVYKQLVAQGFKL